MPGLVGGGGGGWGEVADVDLVLPYKGKGTKTSFGGEGVR